MHELNALIITAASLGFIHTLLGPDHYLPFVVMSRARNWSHRKTAVITVLCGLGHVASSIVLGFIGILVGTAITKLELIESGRGNIAAWVLIAFGLVYLAWGIRKARKGSTHQHLLDKNHSKGKQNITPWILFTIFVLGPCEPLIPILMYPAAQGSYFDIILVALVFAVTTIATMTIMVLLLVKGVNLIPLGKLERYAHALAGLVIMLCGVAIKFGL